MQDLNAAPCPNCSHLPIFNGRKPNVGHFETRNGCSFPLSKQLHTVEHRVTV